MFSLPDLAAFLAVADTGSVRAAAERVHKTQSAVSQAVQRVELAAGVTLLDREAYRATLTSQGELFAKRARPLLEQAEGLSAFASLLRQGVEDRLAIAAHGAISPAFWSKLLAAPARTFPDTVIEMRGGEGDRPLRALADGDAQLAILLSQPSDRLTLTFEYKKIGDMDFATCVRSDLVNGAPPEDILQTLPQILVSDFDDPADPKFGIVEGHRHWRVNSHAAKAAVIRQGLGWGSLPRALVEDALASGELQTVAFGGIKPGSRRPIYLYRRQDRPAGPVAQAIWAQRSD